MLIALTRSDIVGVSILSAGLLFSIGRKKLTVPAALTGAILGWIIYAGAGYTGLAMLTAFFILGTAATSWKKAAKRPFKTDEGPHSTRHTGQVIANAGTAALIGSVLLLVPGHQTFLTIMLASAISAATADTLSSELGMVYGRRCYNILTGKPDKKGLDGVISLEGTLIGVLGSVIIAGIYALGYCDHSIISFLIIVLAGTIGNLTDSVLGATLERNHILSNDGVNFFNTLTAALVAGALSA
jgi:uncharacterized protein (TIGR00297 family)